MKEPNIIFYLKEYHFVVIQQQQYCCTADCVDAYHFVIEKSLHSKGLDLSNHSSGPFIAKPKYIKDLFLASQQCGVNTVFWPKTQSQQ